MYAYYTITLLLYLMYICYLLSFSLYTEHNTSLHYIQSLGNINEILTFSSNGSNQQELSLNYTDDQIGNEDPEKVKLNISVAPGFDPDKVEFIVKNSEITLLDDEGKNTCVYKDI